MKDAPATVDGGTLHAIMAMNLIRHGGMDCLLTSLASTLRVNRAFAHPRRRPAGWSAAAVRAFGTLLILTSSIGNKCAEAQSAANVLLVVNSTSAASGSVSRYYAERRGVPQDNVCSITTPATESISRADYLAQIEQPIWQCIAGLRAHDRILYIVLTKDVPIRISGTGGRAGTYASVDSELTLLYRRRSGQQAPVAGFVPNPYYAGSGPIASIKPFSHELQDIYLVTRLDGFTVQDAIALIDRATTPSRAGRFILDERATLIDSGGDRWLRSAAERLREQGLGDRVELDESTKVLTKEADVLGYYSWGSNDPAIQIRDFELQFVPGAIAGMFVSTDGRTFKEPPATWRPSNDGRRESIFGGSHQSLVGDLIRAGVTGASGFVDEPFLDATIRPEILFPAYVSGRNLAESYYAAMPYLSWQSLVIGDPLCAPFPHTPLDTLAIDPGLDAATELPGYFAKRRLATETASLNKDAAALFVRAESRTARKDSAGVRQALEAAVAADPRFTTARLALATTAEEANDHDKAVAQYRAILGYAPNDSVALNNLAYSLAVHLNKPEDALPFAQRAIAVLQAPQFYDTLAWIQHLLKQDTAAAATIRIARSATTLDPDVVWHAAVIFAAVNDLPRATAELNLALKIKPELADRDDVKKLRQQLSPAAK
jgi:uncharacterized protein (TIGR03790 family)